MNEKKVYVVEGDINTEIEGMIFAICSTRPKAENAIKLSIIGDDLKITEVTLDTLRIDDNIIAV